MQRLKDIYKKEIVNKLKEKFGYKNTLSVPMVKKVVINIGLGKAKENPKLIESFSRDLTAISGQKPLVTQAKKAISGFKIRQGEKNGLKVTLRGQRMYDFLERLSRISIPRIRDFRGLKYSGFDKYGNYSFGIKEHIVFPEIKYDKVEKMFGLGITINTTAKDDENAKELLTLLGFPFEKKTTKEK